MAENKRPLIEVASPKRINFATIKNHRTVSEHNSKAVQSPMASDRNYNASGGSDRLSVLVDTARMQLITPPPEETRGISAQFTPSLLADTGASVNTSTHGATTVAKRKRAQPASTSATPSYSRDQDNDPGVLTQQPIEATPNPKPRKQGRLHSRQPSFESPTRTPFGHLRSSPTSNDETSKQHTPSRSKTKKVLIDSPHANNPDADFIDEMPLPALALPALRRTLLGAKSSRRSATPIPPYEPPTDVFTPPREVFLSPVTKSMSKSSKRKTMTSASNSKSVKGKKKSSTLTIMTAVKRELPDVDLTLPMPPPSPTDDPLLLSGPPEPDFSSEPTPPRRREMSVQIRMEQDNLPPSSPEPLLAMDDEEAVKVFEWNRNENVARETSTDESIMHLDPDDAAISPVRLFDLNDVLPNSNGGWSDSEQEPTVASGAMEEVDEGEGEYTGRWKMMLVRTKQDPPSSATRGRMEQWGRPISPFPKKVPRLSFLEEEEGGEEYQELDRQPEGSYQEDESARHEEEPKEDEEVRQMSVEPEQLSGENEEEIEEDEVRRMSVEPEQLSGEENDKEEEEEVRRMSVEPEQLLRKENDNEEEKVRRISVEPEEEEEEEEREVRQLSVEFDGDEELVSLSDNRDLVPPQFTENSACGNQAVSVPTLVPRRQPLPASATELVVFPSIGSRPERLLSSHPTELEHGLTPAAPNENSWMQTSEQEDDDDQSSDESDELNFVKITSADPRAAARAAAILKQHDYDCYTNIEVKRRHLEAKHRRKSDIEDFARESRRRDIFGSGVTKGSNSRRHRSTLGMGVIGDRVFIPGTPAITLPELLQEAELEVRDSPQRLTQKSLILPGRGDPFKTPIAAKYRAQTASTRMTNRQTEVYGVYGSDIGEREWTKEDWKHLDACFTDQRLELGSRLAGEENLLAPVDMVSIDDIVDKFVMSQGGLETITSFGTLWSRENLLERTRALQKKQRSGHIAPPSTPYTPLSVGSSSNVLGGKERAPRMQVPDFTPLGRRAAPPRKSRLTLPQPVTHDPSSDQEGPIIPPTLLAPRYSHLLEEAVAINQQGSTLSPRQETQDSFPQSEVEETSHSSDVPSRTIGKRVKGFLFSYLPTLPKSSSTARKGPLSLQPSLPLPPIDILSKPRGPVITPARAPLLKPKHPKELVVLHPAPQPPTISHIPRMKKPQRLVDLHPPAPLPIATPIARPRRSSGSSVKDLVRGFEEIQALSHDKPKLNEGWKKYAGRRPHWKP